LRPRRQIAILSLLIILGLAQIVSTYSQIAVTYDEPWHVAVGLEQLQFGTYTYEYQAPPLARWFIATGPYLAGSRLPGHRSIVREGANVLFVDGNSALASGMGYQRNLALARAGVLPFFVLLCIVTFVWAKRWYSPDAGLWAVGILSMTSPILGHAGVATIDIAGAAGMVVGLYVFLRWLEKPDLLHSLLLGVGIAFALMTKLSSLGFLPPCLLVGFLFWRPRLSFKSVAVAAISLFLSVWACYGFSVLPLEPYWGPHPRIDEILKAHQWLEPAWRAAMTTPFPLSELVLGIRDISRHNSQGHESYLLGEFRLTGWWSFFPIVLAVKTPIGLLALSAMGLLAAAWRIRGDPKMRTLTALFMLIIFAVCMTSRIDLGVRHILAVYPLLAILAANLIASSRGWRAFLVIALVGWIGVDAVRAHPDYLAHFNEFAGPHPERLLAESDLDWGQDIGRLSRRLRELNAPSVAIKYFGSAPLENAGLPPFRELDPRDPTTGWIAISLHYLYLEHAHDGSFDWLKRYTPRERIGKSIDLFYLPE
jgi:prepilin-type processing-associated H-X9-DG protein